MASSFPAFDHLNAELSFAIIQCLPVVSSNRLSQTSKRFFYLVHQFRTSLGPEVVCSESRKGLGDAMAVYKDSLLRMRSLPQLVLYFSGQRGAFGFGSPVQNLPVYRSAFPAPRGAVVVGCISPEPSRAVHCGSNHTGTACEIGDYISVMVVGGGLLPEEESSQILQPFRFHAPYRSVPMTNEQFLQQFSARADWKTFIIFASSKFPPSVLEHLQEQYPEALIVGGICDGFFTYLTPIDSEKGRNVSYYYENLEGEAAPSGMTVDEMWQRVGPVLNTHSATACGVALSSDIPFRAVVSHGFASVTQEQDFAVRQSTIQTIRPFQTQFRHSVHEVVSRKPGSGPPLSGWQFYDRFLPDALGIKYPNTDGFTLGRTKFLAGNDLQIATSDPTPLNDFSIDAFRFTKESMLADVEDTLHCLRESLGDQRIMGAVMISCIGRGPNANPFWGEKEADVKRFAATFPGVPCVGWYAEGEIGPRARARREHPSPFRTGEACFQNFTAVFGVFLPPPEDSTTKSDLDDIPSRVGEFVQMRLKSLN